MGITAQEITNIFEKKLYCFNHDLENYGRGKEPEFPMVIFLLGDEAIKGFRKVFSYLLNIWPSYKEELLFIGIAWREDEISFSKIQLKGEEEIIERLAENEVSASLSALFDLASNFKNRSQLMIYYLLDTSNFEDASELKRWISTLKKIKNTMMDNQINILEMLFVMLKENVSSREVYLASRVKNQIRQLYENNIDVVGEVVHNFSTVLLSNHRNDNARLQDWAHAYRIIANTIALTNNNESQIAAALFRRKAFIVGYACEEKPVSKISRVVVLTLLNKLASEEFSIGAKKLSEEELRKKMGINDSGIFEIFHSYVENHLFQKLPSSEQLLLFPRSNADVFTVESLLGCSEYAFNLLTMGAWDCFLEQLMNQVKESITNNEGLKKEFEKQYLDEISKSFTQEELVGLIENYDDPISLVRNVIPPSKDVNIMNAAKERMKYLLSANQEIRRVFSSIIKRIGNDAKQSLKDWEQLVKSRHLVHIERDQNISQYYSRIVEDFIHYNQKKIIGKLNTVSDKRNWEEFIEEILDWLMKYNSSFAAAFEDELESRLSTDQNPKEVKEYISNCLREQSVPVYFQSSFSNGAAIVSCVMVRKDTPLFDSLNQHLKDMYYYNTASGNSAEALYYYEVSNNNLLFEEEKSVEI